MKKNLLLLLCVASMQFVFAGASDYWEGKGRIALSSDGNMHDNDDMQATMMSLMILAKAHLQPQTVLYTYADHVWGSESNDLQIMRESAEGGGQRFGFQATTFIAAVERPEDAYNAMRDEILKSTAEDPLFIIGAGPMHVIGTGIERANAINPEALNHITVISHSNWNNRHSDNPESGGVHGAEPTHSGWTWDEMTAAFGSKVNFNKISDQNGTTDQPYKTKDKFSAPSWDDWAWMGAHQDPNIQWVYTKGKANPGGPDYSDAGMLYYFCADLNNQRADEFGNPEKLRQWLGTDVIDVVVDDTKVWSVNISPTSFTIDNIGDTKQLTVTINPITAINKDVTWSSDNTEIASVDENGLVTAVTKGNAKITVKSVDGEKIATCNITVGTIEAGEVTVGDDFIAIEADATNSPLGNWVVRKPGDDGYGSIAGTPDPINNTYIEYTGGQLSGLGISAGTDALVYKFTPKTSGNYRLTGRMAQRLTVNGVKAAWDQCNDIYVKMSGDFSSGNSTPLGILTNWGKFYGRGKDQWGAFIQADVNHSKYQLIYNLKAGVEYTFSISGRSQRCCIDYFLFTKANLKIAEDVDLAANNDEKYRPGGCTDCGSDHVCETINSVDFDAYTNMGEGFANASIDQTRNVLQMATRLAWGAAEETYSGPDAEVYVALNTMQETDGESSYKVFIAGELIKEVTNDRIYGTEITDYTIQQHLLTETKIAIHTGDIIRVEFSSATNGEVPEGATTATSRGRWKCVQICTNEITGGGNGGGSGEPAEPVFIGHTAPSIVSVNNNTYTFTINYSCTQVVDFATAIHCTTNDNSTEGFKRVNGIQPSEDGTFEVTISSNSPLDPTQGYRWVLYFMPEGGTWRNQYAGIKVPFEVSTATGINEAKDGIKIHPTVFNNVIHLNANVAIKNVTMYDVSSTVIMNKSINEESTDLATSHIKSGLYIIKMRTITGNVITQKVIKR